MQVPKVRMVYEHDLLRSTVHIPEDKGNHGRTTGKKPVYGRISKNSFDLQGDERGNQLIVSASSHLS